MKVQRPVLTKSKATLYLKMLSGHHREHISLQLEGEREHSAVQRSNAFLFNMYETHKCTV